MDRRFTADEVAAIVLERQIEIVNRFVSGPFRQMIDEQIAPAIGDAIVAYSENPQAFFEERFVDERFVLTRRIIGEISQIGALAIAEAAREIVAVLAQQSPEPGFGQVTNAE